MENSWRESNQTMMAVRKSKLPIEHPATETEKLDPVEEASKESFPASDPPAWTLGYEPPPSTRQEIPSSTDSPAEH